MQKPWHIPARLLPGYLRKLAAASRKPEQRMILNTVIARVESAAEMLRVQEGAPWRTSE